MEQADKDKFMKMIEEKSQAITKAVEHLYSKNIYITKEDHFVWLDLTDKLLNGEKWKWLGHELYAVYEDDTEQLLESEEQVDEALKLGHKVCMEVGFIPKDFYFSLLHEMFHAVLKIY